MDKPRLLQELHFAAQPVVAELEASEFIELADRLSACIARAEGGDSAGRNAALREIAGLCHIKAFGDIYVKGPTEHEWLSMLTLLSAAARSLEAAGA